MSLRLEQAQHLQHLLRQKLVLSGQPQPSTLVALDASYKRGGPLVAAAVVWSLTANQVLEVAYGYVPEAELFPYIPGYLSFREAPAYLQAIERLSSPPEMLLVDGQGIAHPRGLGIAAHLGVVLDVPAIGVAKSHLYGDAQGPLGPQQGDFAMLQAPNGPVVGYAVRSKRKVKPLYVSPGHRIGLAESLALVQRLLGPHRLPEPLRQAHLHCGHQRRVLVLPAPA